jgi:hypothetical protein
MSGGRTVRELDTLIARRGRPAMIVSDNSTELSSRGRAGMDQPDRHPVALHHARQTGTECFRAELHRPVPRQVPSVVGGWASSSN